MNYQKIDNHMRHKEYRFKCLEKYNLQNGFDFKYVSECIEFLFNQLGFSPRQIGNIFGYKRCAIYKILFRMGYEMRQHGGLRHCLKKSQYKKTLLNTI